MRNTKGKICLVGWTLIVPFFVLSFVQAFLDPSSTLGLSMSVVAGLLSVVILACLMYVHCNNDFLVEDDAREALDNGGSDGLSITEIRMTFQTMPIIIVANMVFNFAYTMMIGPFLSQSCQMDLKFTSDPKSSQVSGAFFNVGDCLAIIVFIPLFESCLYPLISRLQGGQPVSQKQKLLGGFGWAAIAMISAIVLEYMRRSSDVIAPAGWSADASFATRFPDFDAKYADVYKDYMGQCKVDGIQYCSNCAAQKIFPSWLRRG